MRSTIVKPSNGQAKKNRSRNRSKPSGISLRRLSKRQKEKIYRIFAMVFIIVFTISIVGSLVAVSIKPAGH